MHLFDVGLKTVESVGYETWCWLSRRTYVAGPFEEVEAQLNHHIIFTAKDVRDLASNPPVGYFVNHHMPLGGRTSLLLHDLQIDLLHVHLLVEFGGKLGLPQQFLVDCSRHDE